MKYLFLMHNIYRNLTIYVLTFRIQRLKHILHS
jgi:hypothetical protein